MRGSAALSPCGAYRYHLRRDLDGGGPVVLFVMLNPSTADAERDDPTIRRCVGFARRLLASELHVVNLYALRATEPGWLRRVDDPVGPDNDAAITEASEAADTVIAAWGASVPHPARAERVLDLLRARHPRIWCLGRTKAGRPRHPLYVRGHAPLEEL